MKSNDLKELRAIYTLILIFQGAILVPAVVLWIKGKEDFSDALFLTSAYIGLICLELKRSIRKIEQDNDPRQ